MTRAERRAIMAAPLWHNGGQTYTNAPGDTRVRAITVEHLKAQHLIYWSADGCLDLTGKGEGVRRSLVRDHV